MELTYIYTPARDVAVAASFDRDVLGWDEAWRDGDRTIALRVPGSTVQVMISTTDQPAGPVFRVRDLEDFFADHAHVEVTVGPYAIPGGRNAGVADPAGNTFYVSTSRWPSSSPPPLVRVPSCSDPRKTAAGTRRLLLSPLRHRLARHGCAPHPRVRGAGAPSLRRPRTPCCEDST